MTALEQRLRDALLQAQRKLGTGDFVGAALDLDGAVTLCAGLTGAALEEPARLHELAQACMELARVAARDLEQELAEVGAARAARTAYRG